MKYILILFLINCCYCVQSNKVCDPTLALCSPTWNETWYEYTAHTFSRNLNNTVFLANNITSFDLHLLTINPKSNFKRTIKSWFNLTDPDLTVNVNSDWFPTELTEGPNRTWTFYAFLLSQNALLDPTAMNLSDAFTAFHVIRKESSTTSHCGYHNISALDYCSYRYRQYLDPLNLDYSTLFLA
ncbi:unnamed protein product [Rhizopus stolonifer]